MIKDKDGKINWDRVVAIVGLLITIGAGTIIKSTFNSMVDTAVNSALSNPESDSYRTLVREADSVAAKKTRILMKDVFEDEATKTAIVEAFDGFRGMEHNELVDYLNEKFDFADSVQKMLPQIKANHAWVEKQMTSKPDLIPCGSILAKEGEPKWFKDCDGELRQISYGKPRQNLTRDVYYYRNKHDHPVILSTISTVVFRGE